MKRKDLFISVRGEKGRGRKVESAHILVSPEVKNEIDIFREAYARLYGKAKPITYEQLFRLWVEDIPHRDREIGRLVSQVREGRPDQVAVETSIAAPVINEHETKPSIQNSTTSDSSAPKMKERWKKKYWFVKGDERLEARISKGTGKTASFAVTHDGKNKGFAFMSENGWTLKDEDANVIDEKTAREIWQEYTAHGQAIVSRRAVSSFSNLKNSDALENMPIHLPVIEPDDASAGLSAPTEHEGV